MNKWLKIIFSARQKNVNEMDKLLQAIYYGAILVELLAGVSLFLFILQPTNLVLLTLSIVSAMVTLTMHVMISLGGIEINLIKLRKELKRNEDLSD